MDSSLLWVSKFFVLSRTRWLLLILLIYGVVSVFLVPMIFRQQIIPAVAAHTGGTLSLKDIRWHPFSLKVSLDEMTLGSSTEEPLFTAERLDLDIGLLRSLFLRAVAIDAITLIKPRLDVHPSHGVGTNLDEFLARIRAGAHERSSDTGSDFFRLAISHFQLEEGRIHYAPTSDAPALEIHALAIDVYDLKTWNASEAGFNLALQMNDQALVRAEGTFLSDGSDCDFSAEVHDLHLAQLQSQLPPSLDLPKIEGVLDFSSRLKLKLIPDFQFQMEHVHLAVRDVRLSRPSSDLPLLTLQKGLLDEGHFDLNDHRFDLKAIEIASLGLIGVKDASGRPGWYALMPGPVLSSKASALTTEDTESPPSAWKFGVEQLKLSDFHLIQGSSAPSAYQPAIRLGELEGEGIDLDLGRRILVARSLDLNQSSLQLGLDQAAIHPLDTLVPEGGSDNSPASHEPSSPSKPWTVRILESHIEDLAVAVMRVSAIQPVPFELEHIDIVLGAMDTSSPGETPLTMTSDVTSGGNLEIKGKLNIAAKSFNVDVILNHLGLTPLKSLLSETFRLDTVEGFLSSQLRITADLLDDTPNGDYEGVIELDGLRLTQSPGERKLLGWRSLSVDGIKGRLTPFQFSANEVRLLDPDAVIAIHEDKSSNLSDLRVPQSKAQGPHPRRAAPKASPAPEPDIHLRRIRVEGGKLDYTDESLVLPFSTQIVDLKGAITGWTLDPNGKSLLELNGRIAPYGEAAIHGQLRPFDPKSSLDIDLHFENVVLASLTPYSATFAGRRIENGKLDLNAHYQLEDQQLKSDNRIYLKQLRLGDKVESHKAVSLPLDLAVAILSDTEGNIDLSLPIEGRTDAPDFDYGDVILNAFGNLIKKAVLSPLAAMSGALGLRGGEDLDYIAFDLGSDVLTPPEKEKIARLADALNLKPQLQLTLNGGFDPQQDLRVLRHFWLRQTVGSRLGEVQKPGEDPDPVNPTEPSTQRVLEALAKEYQLLEPALARYLLDKGHPADRIGLVGAYLGKGSKTPDFYESLVQLLADHAPVNSTDLRQLAERRMKRVKDAIAGIQKPVDSRRIHTGDIQEHVSEDDHHLHMPLTLSLDQD